MKVGDYVRTKNGINKIIYIDDIFGSDGKHSFYTIRLDNDNLIFDDEVIKSSQNIIDLIEVGDYVDGLKVIDIVEHLHGHKDIVMTNGKFQWSTSNDDYDIKSIVTKEQFSSMEYKVN